MPLYLVAWTIITASYPEFLSAIFTNYGESRCSCTPYIPEEQILSYYTSAQIITLAACKISHSFENYLNYF